MVGVFGMGVAGAAIATIFAQIVSVIITFKLLAQLEHAGGQIHVWHLHFCAEHMSMMIKIGFPLALQAMLFPIANSIVQASVKHDGERTVLRPGVSVTN